MKLGLEVLGGSRQGERHEVTSRRLTVGRHPACDLQFDPEADRVVSGHHALFLRDEDGWLVRDLGSENGTWVNGEAITSERRLRSGDEVRLGRRGPALRIRLAGGAGREPPSTLSTPGLFEDGWPGPGQLWRTTREVVRRHRLAPVVLVAAAALAALYLVSWRPGGANGTGPNTSELVQRTRSVLESSGQTVDSLEEEVSSLRRELRRSREELDRARGTGSGTGGNGASSDDPSVRELQRQLRSARAALERQQLAADVDFAAIEEDNWRALAQVYAQRADSSVNTGTAFGVRSDGLLVTSRHVVVGADGTARFRIAVQFARSEQVWPAEVVAASEPHDLALVRVRNIRGEIPTVRALNDRADTLSSGVPLAVLGYSLGGQPAMEGASARPLREPLLTTGLLDGRSNGLLEIQGFGERGGSGSPIFDSDGKVVAVLKGGRRAEGGKTLAGVPAGVVGSLLEAVPARTGR